MEDQPSTVPSSADNGPNKASYNVSVNIQDLRGMWGTLIDRGANGIIAGSNDTTVLEWLMGSIDLTGVNNHTVNNLKMVTAAG